MTIDDVETLQDLGIYYSNWVRVNCNSFDRDSVKMAGDYLNKLASHFKLLENEKHYIASRVFLQESQSNEATLKLARMANTIKIKARGK